MSCYQLTVTGGGNASPALVKFPGAYQQSDLGIGTSIHGNLSSYVIPGPAVYSGGVKRVPGNGLCVGVESGTAPGTGPTTTPVVVQPTSAGAVTTTLVTSSTSRPATATTTTAAGTVGCQVAKYGQCGGQGYTGCTVCVVSLD